MIEIYERDPARERVGELLDIVTRDDRAGDVVSRNDEERRYVESIRLNQRMVRRVWPRKVAGSRMSFVEADAGELAEWLARSVHSVSEADAADAHCRAASLIMRAHAPYNVMVTPNPPGRFAASVNSELGSLVDISSGLESCEQSSPAYLASRSWDLLSVATQVDRDVSSRTGIVALWHWFFGDLENVPGELEYRLRNARAPRSQMLARGALAVFMNDVGEVKAAERLFLQSLELDKLDLTALLNGLIWLSLNGRRRLSRKILGAVASENGPEVVRARWAWADLERIIDANVRVRQMDPQDSADIKSLILEVLYHEGVS